LSLDTDSFSIDSIVFQFLLHITSILQGSQTYNNFEALRLLQQFMAVPIMVYNDIFMGEWIYDNTSIPNNLNRNATFVTQAYQVFPRLPWILLSQKVEISNISFWTFAVVACFLLLWTVTLTVYSVRVPLPNSSSSPEIDFASKCLPTRQTFNESSEKSLSNLLYPLSNAQSSTVFKRIAGKNFFMGVREEESWQMHDEEDRNHAALYLEKPLGSAN
jgi:hypothetical protein